ncbi:MAG: HD domain-containing protein [Bacilli bacterium]|nr:HD domain-containing protein [Bacilli bacterium]
MKINKDLKKHIEQNVFPIYNKNEEGHGINHILYVIKRSLKFAKEVKDINYDMVYTIAAYHDCGHHISHENHEIISAKIFLDDHNLLDFFNQDQIITMKEAIEDHRASSGNEPRTIYGKIVSSADRNTNIEELFKRTYSYRKKDSNYSNIDSIIEEAKNHIIKKFGKSGYANEKMYFDDPEYKQFLNDIEVLVADHDQFITRYKKANNINI